MNKKLGIIFFLLIHFILVQSLLKYLYHLKHQQAIDQLDQQGGINGHKTKFGLQNREAENAKILDVVILIQEGSIPENVRVLNTTYNTQEVNARNLTVYDTTYEQGNGEEGTKNQVRIILDPYPEENQSMTDWWIDSSKWKGDISILSLTHYRLWRNGKKIQNSKTIKCRLYTF